MLIKRITIVQVRRPKENSINDELQWLGSSLGLFGDRDRDKSCFRIFIQLMKTLKNSRGLTSDQLADQLALTRGTVIHHLNSLMERGIVVHEGNIYAMRAEKLTSLVEDLQKDMERTMLEMKKAAEDLDRILEL